MDDFVDPTALELERFAIGQPVPRSEDPVLVCGKGQFTDDVNLAGQAYAVIVRSSFAHGMIRHIDTAAARGMSGVLGVYTAADLEAAGIGRLPPRRLWPW
jgi:carbon-monoxide dehydrogenase large subunit